MLILKQTAKALAGLALIALVGAAALAGPDAEQAFACSIHGRDCQ